MSVMEQIKVLESRIEKAIAMIKTLRAENLQLRTELSGAKTRGVELEGIVSSLRNGNLEAETELADVIKIFDDFEKSDPMTDVQGVTVEIKDAAAEFSFAANTGDVQPDVADNPGDDAVKVEDQQNIF